MSEYPEFIYTEMMAGRLAIFKGCEPGAWVLTVKPWNLRWRIDGGRQDEAFAAAALHFAPRYRFSFWARAMREYRNHWRRFVMAVKAQVKA